MDEMALAREKEESAAAEARLDAEIDRDLRDVQPCSTAKDEQEKQLSKLVRILNRYEAEALRFDDQAKAESRSLHGKAERFFNRYATLMQELTRSILGADLQAGRRKSLRTGYGTAGFRQRGGNVKCENLAALAGGMDSKEQFDEFIRTRHEPNLKAINDHYKATGELLPGCDVEPVQDRFYVD